MDNNLRNILNEYPEIDNVLSGKHNSLKFWFGAARLPEENETYEKIKQIEESMQQFATNEEQAEFINQQLCQISNLYADLLGAQVDMAFVLGFKAGGKLILEIER